MTPLAGALLASAGRWPDAAGLGQPPPIGRAAARELARRELAKSIYHRGDSVVARAWAEIVSQLDRLFGQANSALPGGWWALVALAVLAVIIVAVIVHRLGPVSAAHRLRRATLVGGATASARDHRERARQLAADGNWARAIRESLRAIAQDLEERAILPPSAGRTADELAVEAGRALPAWADPLRSAARLFDDVCYGDRPGSPDGYARLRQLDADIHTARPVPLQPVQGVHGVELAGVGVQPAGHGGSAA